PLPRSQRGGRRRRRRGHGHLLCRHPGLHDLLEPLGQRVHQDRVVLRPQLLTSGHGCAQGLARYLGHASLSSSFPSGAMPASSSTAATNCASGSAPTNAPSSFTTVRGTPWTPNLRDRSGNSLASIVRALTLLDARAIRFARLTAWGQYRHVGVAK